MTSHGRGNFQDTVSWGKRYLTRGHTRQSRQIPWYARQRPRDQAHIQQAAGTQRVAGERFHEELRRQFFSKNSAQRIRLCLSMVWRAGRVRTDEGRVGKMRDQLG